MGAHEGGPPMGMIEDVGDAQAEADRWNSKGKCVVCCVSRALKKSLGRARTG